MAQKGFTLIEFIIYIGILSAVLILATSFTWDILYSESKINANREIEHQAWFAMEKITGAINSASSISDPLPGASGNSFVLVLDNPDLNPTVFDVLDNKLRMRQGAGEPSFLTSDRARVANLNFTNVSYLGTPGAIRIELRMEYGDPGGKNEYKASIDLVNTAVIRR